jgi:hypothetical protein
VSDEGRAEEQTSSDAIEQQEQGNRIKPLALVGGFATVRVAIISRLPSLLPVPVPHAMKLSSDSSPFVTHTHPSDSNFTQTA